MQVWNVLHAARWKIQDAKKSPKIAIWAPSHNFVGYIFAIKARIDNRKNFLSSSMSSICPHNMVNFGPLTAEIGSGVWGTPANFNWFYVLAALMHAASSSGHQPNFAALNRRRHLCSAGRPSRWALAHILVLAIFSDCDLVLWRTSESNLDNAVMNQNAK